MPIPLLTLLPLLMLSAAQATPSLPVPPEGLSSSLIVATRTLFAQGFPDPRGGKYRTITVETGNPWNGRDRPTETHGWVFAGTNRKAYAVCWNGLVYPVVADRAAADLSKDIGALIGKYQERVRRSDSRYGAFFWNDVVPEAVSLDPTYPSLLKTVFLLRLGKTKLAQAFYRLWEKGTNPNVNDHDSIRRNPYPHLAAQWAWSVYDRAVCAHMRGADRLAAADTELLTRLGPRIEAEVRTQPLGPDGGLRTPGTAYLVYMGNLPELRRDTLRRLNEPPLPPYETVKAAWAKLTKAQRIGRLIARLDEIDERQSGQPGGVAVSVHPIAQALIAEGDAAIEPLLDVLEKDDRLTRSVSFSRSFFQERRLIPVRAVAFACFAQITGVTQIGEGAGSEGTPSLAALRTWWAKNRDLSGPERWFAQLAEDGPEEKLRARWKEAAQKIVERTTISSSGKGESLRGHRNPSVSDLLRRRALAVTEPIENRSGFDEAAGANFALMLYEWDPQGTETLPTVRTVLQRCTAFSATRKRGEGDHEQYQLGGRIARLAIACLRLGDMAAVREYGDWLKTVTPESLGFETGSALALFRYETASPAVLPLATELFTEPSGAWSHLLSDPKSRGNYASESIFASELLKYDVFRALVRHRLMNVTEAGTVTQNQLLWADGGSQGATPPTKDPFTGHPLRLCDRAAIALQPLAGMPIFDLYASVAERDSQIAAIIAYLDRYGATLGPALMYDSPLYAHYDLRLSGYLGPTFPKRTAPATENDVRENRAIFALPAGQVRIVPGLTLPFAAQWNNDPHGKPNLWSHGVVWQAEEVFEDGQWMRYYGYVGTHTIARVPAGEITYPGGTPLTQP